MSSLSQQSKLTGLAIRKCKPDEQFYPLPEKYITLQNNADWDSKKYDYYLDIIEYIKDLGYIILQVDNDSPPLPHCQKTTLNLAQTNYVIRNSSLHFGNDCFCAHLASVHGVPNVILYGPTDGNIGGLHFSKAISVTSGSKTKPSFQPNENPKSINLIKPEDAANKIIEVLGGGGVEDKTVFAGPQYGRHFIEIVPNTVVNPQSLQGQVPTIRCDYEYNEEILSQNLSQTKASIITDKETKLDLYRHFRQNIQNINFKVSMDTDLDYVKKLRNIGIETRLWFDDEENKNEILFKFLDIEQPHFVEYREFEEEIKAGMKYRSFKFLLSNGKIYISKKAYLEDRPVESPQDNWLEIKEIDGELKKEMEYFRIIA